MLTYTLRRILGMIPTLLLISVVCFTVIQLQPGSFLDQYLEDPRVTKETVASVTRQLGLDQPLWVQYLTWIKGIVTQGDFGYSFVNGRPVSSLIWERLGWTVFLALLTLIVSWAIAVPLGIYTALNRYSKRSVALNFFGYVSLATPDFLVALLLIALVLNMGGTNVGGLFSPQFIDAPWSGAKVMDLLGHLWIPMIAIGLEGVAGLMRQMRASMLDVIGQDYVRTARAKGLAGRRVLWKHAVRNAVNPLISLAGLSLPSLISGTIIASIVLNLPTIGPFLYDSLLNKDQYVAMTLLLFSALLLLIGNLLSDLALAWADPRVRFE
ncbi:MULTISPECIES: ABC transporter permease [Deinococcus]|jgi:peptide/nickel transport system permease protein|uniref:Dipeptide transport system permease protein DppB n=1 Tax=Deinococcus caeni TaxID=569127 RepID=A0ABP9U9D7_9DEIO|nr:MULTISPECIES: ABC transporter permease [unclassified Deinococcus]MBX8466879.1 ABC transporter permease [Deinococcus sp. RIT780]MCD0158095.1 ABC transporter permease [Deinococcus sp. 6GRE01]MCD0163124.1 ABC transporter permease [Deinococcus sp. 6YEL10]MCD0166143.1 ABC transporter permease [Deinococcus sp. 12RED42]MCD0170392.1 ABC transporter permease [Deinococcus sp. 23YEL01]